MNPLVKLLRIVAAVSFLILSTVAEVQSQSTARPSDILNEARQAMANLKPGLQRRLIPSIAVLEAKNGNELEARNILKKTIHITLPLKGRVHDGHNGPSEFFFGLLALAVAQAQVGDAAGHKATIKKAVDLVVTTTDNRDRLVDYLTITAQNLTRAGHWHGIESTLTPIHEVQRTLSLIHEVQSALSLIREQLPTEKERRGKCSDLTARMWDVRVFIDQGNLGRAHEILNGIPEACKSVHRWEWIIIFTRLGKVEQAQQFLASILEAQTTNNPLSDFMVNTENRLKAAKVFIAAGRLAAAQGLLQEAIASTTEIIQTNTNIEDRPDFALFVWRNMAVAQAKLGDLQGAQETLRRVPPDAGRGEVLTALVEAQLKVGHFEAARRTARDPASHLDAIIATQVTYGDVVGAKLSMAALKKNKDSDEVLQRYRTKYHINEYPRDYQNSVRMVATARVRAGDVSNTILWARSQPSPDLKAFALLGVAEGLFSEQEVNNRIAESEEGS